MKAKTLDVKKREVVATYEEAIEKTLNNIEGIEDEIGVGSVDLRSLYSLEMHLNHLRVDLARFKIEWE